MNPGMNCYAEQIKSVIERVFADQLAEIASRLSRLTVKGEARRFCRKPHGLDQLNLASETSWKDLVRVGLGSSGAHTILPHSMQHYRCLKLILKI
jgi:hypothetical protein